MSAAPSAGAAPSREGSLPADLAQSPPAAWSFAPPLLDGRAADGFVVTTTPAPQAPETAGSRPVAAFRAGGGQATDSLDAVFARLGDQGGSADFIGDPGEAQE